MSYSNTQRRRDDEVTFDLMESLVVFGRRKDSGWTKEANIVAWNNGTPKLDIREWDPDHERMSKGVTLYEAEAEKLAKVLCRRYGIRTQTGGGYESFADDEPFEAVESVDAEESAVSDGSPGGTS